MQIHAQDDVPANVRSYERLDGSAGDEAVCSRVRWNAIENLREYLALHLFEMRFRRFNKPDIAEPDVA